MEQQLAGGGTPYLRTLYADPGGVLRAQLPHEQLNEDGFFAGVNGDLPACLPAVGNATGDEAIANRKNRRPPFNIIREVYIQVLYIYIGSWGAETNREIVSFRSCERAGGRAREIKSIQVTSVYFPDDCSFLRLLPGRGLKQNSSGFSITVISQVVIYMKRKFVIGKTNVFLIHFVALFAFPHKDFQ